MGCEDGRQRHRSPSQGSSPTAAVLGPSWRQQLRHRAPRSLSGCAGNKPSFRGFPDKSCAM